ncbi:MAG: sporulation protein YtxC [Clostridia bacterium]|nr:sporulation protein YtxC [Clostridia bacterium]
MWELTILFSKCDEIFINTLKKLLLKSFKNSKFICTTLDEKTQTKLLVACENSQKTKLKKILDEVLSELFVTDYKERYLKSNLTLTNIDEISLKAFIKALVCFDKEYDKNFVIQKLNYSGTLYIQSFFAFKLKSLKQKWKDICELTNDNSMFLKTEGIFLELLKFLIKNLKIKEKTVNIIYKNNTYKFLDENNKKIKLQNELNEEEEIFLITNLITLNPKAINLYCDSSIKVKTLNLLNELFGSKITLCKN